MPFTVYLKEDEGQQINNILDTNIRSFNVSAVIIADGLLKKGNYWIPVSNILFIKEV